MSARRCQARPVFLLIALAILTRCVIRAQQGAALDGLRLLWHTVLQVPVSPLSPSLLPGKRHTVRLVCRNARLGHTIQHVCAARSLRICDLTRQHASGGASHLADGWPQSTCTYSHASLYIAATADLSDVDRDCDAREEQPCKASDTATCLPCFLHSCPVSEGCYLQACNPLGGTESCMTLSQDSKFAELCPGHDLKVLHTQPIHKFQDHIVTMDDFKIAKAQAGHSDESQSCDFLWHRLTVHSTQMTWKKSIRIQQTSCGKC